MKSINYKAVSLGFSAYILVWGLWSLVSLIISSQSEIIVYLISVTTNFAGLVPGYVAAQIAKERQLLHGLISGVSVGIGILVFWNLAGVLENSAWHLYMILPTNTAIMALIGGIISKYYYELKRNNAL